MMHVILMYDISNDRTRNKVIIACEDYGLDRVQYSTFYGKLKRVHQRELMLRMKDLLDDQEEKAVVQLVTIGEDDWKKRIEVKLTVKSHQADERDSEPKAEGDDDDDNE